MLLFLLVVTVSVAFAEDAQVAEEPIVAESARHGNHHGHSYSDGLELVRDRNRASATAPHDDQEHEYSYHVEDNEDDHNEVPGPVILRTPHPLAHDGHVDIEAQNKIIEDVYSPDYHQPTWVLDYRYLKTGGRDYVRGPGGQILILPKGVRSKEHKEFPDYDAYLEHLRLSRLAKEQHHRHGDDDNHGPHHYKKRGEHGQTLWRKN